ncbi:cell division protein ZapA [uncultured Alsobacter sp.]|uniref:cell division protein ZapA n=1 Tax=uncultured Alsobacter sp. TaxID=1748258 RepID=UPI0025DF99AD|nr:cell division protein ZapA [uncultured Alsobacter sp.]
MAQVTVTIAEKVYRIACDDGQEDHLRSLAAEVDGKIGQMRQTFGEIGDNRLTVMAAITFVDEREELRARIAALETEVARLGEARQLVEEAVGRTERDVAAAVMDAAQRIEAVAQRLASPAAA